MAEVSPFDYRYPLSKLSETDDYLKITILEYKAPGFISEGGTFAAPSANEIILNSVGDVRDITKIIGSIILPIPDNITDVNSTNWGASSFNPLEVAAAGGVQGLLSSGDVNDLQNKITNAAGKVMDTATSGSVQKFFSALGIQMASNILLSGNKGINETFSRYSGSITNSNIELIFTGVNLRQAFTFAFDMVPRSKQEAIRIKDIIRKFKIYSAAKKDKNGLFLKAPEVFKLEYMSGKTRHPYLNRFKICALTGVSVNYTGSGTYATYSDGAPVNIVLGLSFQELSPIYSEDYDTTLGREGTGF